MSFRLHGLVAATHSPFHPDGTLAPEVVPLQAAHLAASGVATAFITGSTGESHSLTREERMQLFGAWSVAGPAHGLKVVAHVGSNCLEDAKVLSREAAACGLDAVCAQAPCYYKPARLEGLVRWCADIAAQAPELPFYYYDIPVLTGVKFDMEDFLEMAGREIPTLAGIKFTNPDLEAFARCVRFGDGRYDIPWGIDERMAEGLAAGASGAVGSSYNFAAPLYHELMAAFAKGDLGAAQKLQHESVRMIDTLAAAGYLGAAKALMGWLGVPVGPVRQPLDNPAPEQLRKTKAKLAEMTWFGKNLR